MNERQQQLKGALWAAIRANPVAQQRAAGQQVDASLAREAMEEMAFIVAGRLMKQGWPRADAEAVANEAVATWWHWGTARTLEWIRSKEGI